MEKLHHLRIGWNTDSFAQHHTFLRNQKNLNVFNSELVKHLPSQGFLSDKQFNVLTVIPKRVYQVVQKIGEA